MSTRKVSDEERRARLGRRHCLAPGTKAADPVEAARRVVCLHGTDPATVYLSAWARLEEMSVADLDTALYEERSLVKHLAMRRTLFVFPREVLPLAQAAASRRVAGAERRRLVKEVEKAGLFADGSAWLEDAREQVLAALAGGRETSSSELRQELEVLQGTITYGEGKSWGGKMPIGPRVLTVLSAEGELMRASNDGAWSTSRPRWTTMASWLGGEIARPSDAEGTAGMVERWLRAFGPGTEADIKWWLGSTLTAVRAALVEIGAVEVELETGETGYLLGDDLEPVSGPEPWAALLPSLDPTTMGWAGPGRGFYLGPHAGQLFDTSGNAGPVVLWCGRAVGGWNQREDSTVELQMLEDVGSEARAALDAEAERLSGWLGDKRLLPRFPSPLFKSGLAG